jgi:3-oxoacyl-[acyl-carrier protein] reductase
MASWAKTLANELGEFGITVNNLLPGHTKTKRLESLIATNSSKQGIAYEELENEMIADIPTGRFGEPWEFAAAAGFLSSDFASFINGVNIPIDGGFLKSL